VTTFAKILQRSYREHPEKNALTLLTTGQPDQSISMAQLLQGAAGYAQTLQNHGIQPGEIVVLILQHGLDLVYAYFGCILQGAIPSIMPFLTEKLLPERYRADLAALVSVTQPAAIITYPDFESEVRAALKPGDSVRLVLLCTQALPPSPPDFDQLPGLLRTPQDIVLLQHSSGTTGLQKGVALSHQAVHNQLQSYSKAIRLNEQDVIVSWLPLYHDMGLIAGFLMPILLGIPLVLMSPFDWVRSPVRLLQAVSRYHGTLSWLPNFAYNFCAQKIRTRDLEGLDLSSWRAVINCSEPMRWESQQNFLQRFQPYGLRPSALCTCYAMAENVFAVTQGGIDSPVTVEAINRDALQTRRSAPLATPNEPSINMLSAGRPIQGVSIQILDENGQALPERSIGEIAIQSHCMLSEYYHRPDATAQALINGWYRTGDLGYQANGELYITGRKKDLIIVGGKNIYPQDLELLAMEVPGVHMGRVSAFGIFNDETGTEDVVIVAETDAQTPAEREAIADQIRQVVTRGSAIALHHVYIVDRHWLVKTSSGKTARSANKEKYLAEIAHA
jgi:acyl-CoA synthetase (AMP-forming)/AMP-acid ligase II